MLGIATSENPNRLPFFMSLLRFSCSFLRAGAIVIPSPWWYSAHCIEHPVVRYNRDGRLKKEQYLSLETCRAILEEIRKWQRRNAALALRGLPAGEAIGTLIDLAAKFAIELEEIGLRGELSRGSDLFDSLTQSGSAFDLVRVAVQKHLNVNASRIYLPDWNARTSFATRRIYLGPPEPRKSHPEPGYPNRVRKICSALSNLAEVRLNLGPALKDANELCGLKLPAADRDIVEAWRQQIIDVTTRCAQEHLIGAHLLEECRKSREERSHGHASHRDLRRYHDVERLLSRDEHVLALKDAAEAFYRLALRPGADFGPRHSWCHGADATPPLAFKHGPLRGKLLTLIKPKPLT